MVLVLATVNVGAQEFSLSLLQQTYAPYETVQARITATHLANIPTEQDILLMDDQGNKVQAAPTITSINDTVFFVTLALPYVSDSTYTLLIKNVRFLLNGQLTKVQEAVNFTVLTTAPQIGVTPGVIVAKPDDAFTIVLKSEQQTTVTVTAPSFVNHVYAQQQPLGAKSKRTFTFHIDPELSATSEGFIEFTAFSKSWVVPLYVIKEQETIQQPMNNTLIPVALLTTSTKITKTLAVGDEIKGTIPLQNALNAPLSFVTLTLEGDITEIASLPTAAFENIQPLQTINPLLIIHPGPETTPRTYTGTLTIRANDYALPLSIEVTVVPQLTPSSEEPILPELSTGTSDEEPLFQEPGSAPLLDLNLSEGQTHPAKRPILLGPFVIVFLLVLAAIFIYLFSRKKREQKSLTEYVKEIEQRRK